MPGRIGPWLQRELDQREWRAADLSRKLDVSSATVSRWLNGERVPSPESCDHLADVLGADGDYVLTLAGHRPADPEPDPERAHLLASLSRAELTPERVLVLRALFDVWARLPVEDNAPPGKHP